MQLENLQILAAQLHMDRLVEAVDKVQTKLKLVEENSKVAQSLEERHDKTQRWQVVTPGAGTITNAVSSKAGVLVPSAGTITLSSKSVPASFIEKDHMCLKPNGGDNDNYLTKDGEIAPENVAIIIDNLSNINKRENCSPNDELKHCMVIDDHPIQKKIMVSSEIHTRQEKTKKYLHFQYKCQDRNKK